MLRACMSEKAFGSGAEAGTVVDGVVTGSAGSA